MTSSPALLACDQLTVRFGGLTALNALSLEVRQEEVVGLIGPNGSGKTTFFNAVSGFCRMAGGRFAFAGEELTGARPQAVYRAGIARTFQRSRLCLALSVFDNLMIGNHRNLDLRITFNLLRRRAFGAQLNRYLDRARALLAQFHPDLPQRIFEPAAALGMIDRRRVEVCRALMSDPKLLLLDEPSAGMTHDETRELMDDILATKARSPGLAVILIEHEMNVIERVTDRCVVLNFGEKICEGPYAAVAADPRVQEAYLGTD